MKNIFIILNGKGGCGKTTLSRELAACTAENGHQTLLVDFDAHAAATRTLNLQYAPTGTSAADILLNVDHPHAPGYILPTSIKNLYILPANKDMDELAKEFDFKVFLNRDGNGEKYSSYRYFKMFLEKIPGYEYVFVDCCDRLDNPLVMNALLTGGDILVPVIPKVTGSVEGVIEVIEKLDVYNKIHENCAKILGVVLIGADLRSSVSKYNMKDLKELPRNIHIFQTQIRHSIRIDDIGRLMKPLIAAYPREEITQDFRMLTKEVLIYAETVKNDGRNVSAI